MAALSWAAKRGRSTTLALLIEKGADQSIRDKKGWTPLMHAAGKGDVASAQVLLDHGADPAAKDQEGLTALMVAKKKRRHKMTELLSALPATDEAKAPVPPEGKD